MARRRPTEPTANPARGAILVAVAVVVGLVLLRHGLDTSETIIPSTTDGASTDSTDSSTDGTSVDDGTDGTDGSTTARQPSEVPTIVLNGSGIQGAAGRYSTALATLGYNLTDADGANSTSNVTATQVLYAPGYELEAQAVASAIGAPASTVAPMTTTVPGTISGAQVVVVLGPDLGGQEPPDAADAALTTG